MKNQDSETSLAWRVATYGSAKYPRSSISFFTKFAWAVLQCRTRRLAQRTQCDRDGDNRLQCESVEARATLGRTALQPPQSPVSASCTPAQRQRRWRARCAWKPPAARTPPAVAAWRAASERSPSRARSGPSALCCCRPQPGRAASDGGSITFCRQRVGRSHAQKKQANKQAYDGGAGHCKTCCERRTAWSYPPMALMRSPARQCWSASRRICFTCCRHLALAASESLPSSIFPAAALASPPSVAVGGGAAAPS